MAEKEIADKRSKGVLMRLVRCIPCDGGSVQPFIVSVLPDLPAPACSRCGKTMTVVRELEVDTEPILLGISGIESDGKSTLRGI